jgi:hypothetical protein
MPPAEMCPSSQSCWCGGVGTEEVANLEEKVKSRDNESRLIHTGGL